MSNIDIDDLVSQMSRLKNVPIDKATRNAARDFVRGAYMAAPIAAVRRSKFAKVTLKTGKEQVLNITKAAQQSAAAASKERRAEVRKATRARLEARRIVIRRGFAKATWIGAFRALGVTTNKPAKNLSETLTRLSKVTWHTKDSEASVEITDQNLAFKHHIDAGNAMLMAGLDRAKDILLKNITKEIMKRV
jgi:hypothetical protein